MTMTTTWHARQSHVTRLLLTCMALVCVMLLCAPTLTANAATPLRAPVAHVTRTADGATVKWAKVKHAVKYKIAYATNKQLRHASIKRTKQTHVSLNVGPRKYYIRVTALGTRGKTHPGKIVTLAQGKAIAPRNVLAIPGDQRIALAWQAGPGSTRYAIQYGTDATLKKFATANPGVATSTTLRNLTNDTKYYVRFVATRNGYASVTSAIQKITPTVVLSAKPGIQVTPTADNVLHVTWTGVNRGTAAQISVGANSGMTRNAFTSTLQQITTSSLNVTIPTRLRAALGASSANPVYVRVNLYNSANVTPKNTTAVPVGVEKKTSDAAIVYVPTTPVGGGSGLRVATYNMQSVTAALAQSNYPYAARRTALVNAVKKAHPDVLVAQELTLRAAKDGSKTTQAADMAKLLAKKANGGYAWATPKVKMVPWAGGSSAGVNIFYKKKLATLLAYKVLPASRLNVNYPTDLVDQYWSIAKFRLHATGKIFYVVGAHLAPGTDQATHDLRNRQLAAMDKYVTGGAGNAPVIFAGDFNGNVTDSDSPESGVLINRGYRDAATAPIRYGARYATENQDDRPAEHYGYPTTPTPYSNPAPRIDYIMTRHMPPADAYANQVVLLADGTFDPAYQGSDHNLQVAKVRIP